MKNPLVSILIPYKNVEDFFEECLQSIVLQTYRNWEIIAVNDHSTDRSEAILNKFIQQDSRIKALRNSSNGIIAALQMAYKNCNGDYITRMDSDDIMMPNKLEVMANSLLKNGKGHLAIGHVKYFSNQGLGNGYARYEKWLNKLTNTGSNYSDIYKECVIPSPCWMIHRTDFNLVDAFNPNRYPEDYDLAFRFYKNNIKCIPCNEVLHQWRDYDTRTSRTSEHYAQNYFLEIKLHYFLKLEYALERPLVVWGAGNKGKAIAHSLVEQNINFNWLCNNPKKIGKDIYGIKLQHYSSLTNLINSQTIVTVANVADQIFIKKAFKQLKQEPSKDYFFFC